ncbi:MAG: thioredoxin domain-containing protein [Bacteroidota bacterium]
MAGEIGILADYSDCDSMKNRFFTVFCFVLFAFGSCQENPGRPLDTQHAFTNALIKETSPYLLQHAHNPVDWRPWGSKALDLAKEQDKLLLISIGYSSCHWCHVMEEETFEDERVAQIMNQDFISIKVDREERPDVDTIYQTFAQLTDSNTGWPLNIIALPNGKPLYGNTYHTKAQWMQVLSKISDLYRNNPEKAAEYADMVAQGIQDVNKIQPSDDFEILNKATLKESVDTWKPNWDLEWGGDKGRQKFLIPGNMDFLMDYAGLTGDTLARTHVKNTLDKTILGGIYDPIEGGFFRYSTDPEWKVPHFEKMLYDNAQALSLFSKAYAIYDDMGYRDIVQRTKDFLQSRMRHPGGAYYAAMDADSEGKEGKYYVWSEEELKSLLGGDFELFAKYYNINKEAIWEKEAYVLHKLMPDADFCKVNKIVPSDLNVKKKSWRKQLLDARLKRVAPLLDDKIITSWNALLINGFVDAYTAFGQKEDLQEAQAIFTFIQNNSYHNGELIHSYKKGGRQVPGFLDDYAFMADASLKLYEVTMDISYLEFAQEVTKTAITLFSDEASGMFRYKKNQDLIAKILKTNDGKLASPNAMMAHNLFRLGHINYDTDFLKRSKTMLSTMIPAVLESAPGYAKWNTLLLHTSHPYYEIAVVGGNAMALVKELNTRFIPNTLVVGSPVASSLPLFEYRYVDDETSIFVCQNGSCKLPVETVQEALLQLGLPYGIPQSP